MRLGLGLGLNFTSGDGGGGSPAFSSSYPANMVAWYDESSRDVTSGQISSWNDKTANAYHATQSTSANKPTTGTQTQNGLGVVTFDPTTATQLLNFPSALRSVMTSQECTVFVVGKLNGTVTNEHRFITGRVSTSTRFSIASDGAGSLLRAQCNTAAVNVDQTFSWGTTPHIFGMIRNGIGGCSFMDGTCRTSQGAMASPTLSDFTMGGRADLMQSFSLNGWISEVIMYNRRLSQSEMRTVYTYLSSKWGITVSSFADPTKSGAFFGDSITEGSQASASQFYWWNVMSDSIGIDASLRKGAGISGTPVQNSIFSGSAVSNNARDSYTTRVLGANKADLIYLLYGLNDVGYNTSGTGFSLSNFNNDYREIMDGLLAGFYRRDQIVLGSPPWIPSGNYNYSGTFTGSNATIHQQHVDAVRQIAVDYQVRYADVFAYMRDNGGATLINGASEIHPNDLGMAAIAASMGAAAYVS